MLQPNFFDSKVHPLHYIYVSTVDGTIENYHTLITEAELARIEGTAKVVPDTYKLIYDGEEYKNIVISLK